LQGLCSQADRLRRLITFVRQGARPWRSGFKQMENENAMTKQSHDCGRLEGSEAFGLYLTEIASSVLAISQQSALLLQALSERAVLLADMAEQVENSVSATSRTAGEAGQCHQASGPMESRNTSTFAADNNRITTA